METSVYVSSSLAPELACSEADFFVFFLCSELPGPSGTTTAVVFLVILAGTFLFLLLFFLIYQAGR